MDVAVGLPNPVPGTTGDQLTEWARRADAAGFSSLGTIDRTVYPNYEPLIALAAAAAVTERIGLATTILIAPPRANAVLLAKQAASVHRLSGGRLTLGIAVGAREDDYEVSPADFRTRGKEFDGLIETVKRTWEESGKASGAPGLEVGPHVADDPPQLLLGGSSDAAFRRAAEYADGWIMGGGTPEQFEQSKAILDQAWKDAGREGEPRTGALAYFSLGDQAEENARTYLGDYYSWLGEEIVDVLVSSAAKDADTVASYQRAFADVGCGELFWMPCSSDPAQVDLLGAAAL